MAKARHASGKRRSLLRSLEEAASASVSGDWRVRLIQTASDAQIGKKCLNALDTLLMQDAGLLQRNASERSISHRLGLYLTTMFPDWDVDCEYNRDDHKPKRLVLSDECREADNSRPGSKVLPDVIVHHRRTHDNLLVIEIKKSTSTISADCDLEKLSRFRTQLGYQHALFIEFITGQEVADISRVEWVVGP